MNFQGERIRLCGIRMAWADGRGVSCQSIHHESLPGGTRVPGTHVFPN